MNYKTTITQKGLLYIVQKKRSRKRRRKQIPKKLQRAIDDCATIPQLLELLFRTDLVKNEAVLDAFDRKLDELDPPFKTLILNLIN